MNELITIEKAQVMDVFTKREVINPILEKIKHATDNVGTDVTTDKGRKAIASMAYRVAQSKTYIDSHGKELAAELKELPKIVDANRKYARDYLDKLKSEIRKPLDEYEQEQEKIKMLAQIEKDHEQALLDHLEWEKMQAEKRLREEQERKEYEERVRKQAMEDAEKEAERKAQQAIIEAKAAQIAAEKEAARLQEQQEREIKQAELRERQKAKDEAERIAREQRIVKEKEEQKKLRAEKEKMRQENIDNVHQSIINDFMKIGLNKEQSQYILDAVANNKIERMRINY